MGRTRVSVAALMALVAFAALGFAALRTPSELWANTIFTLMLATLFAGLLGVLLLPRDDRAFWIGFTLFGWGYAVLCFGPWFGAEVAPYLITTDLLAFYFSLADPGRFLPVYGNPLGRTTSYHLRLGQSVLDLIISLIGGIAAHAFVIRHPRRTNRGAGDPGMSPRCGIGERYGPSGKSVDTPLSDQARGAGCPPEKEVQSN